MLDITNLEKAAQSKGWHISGTPKTTNDGIAEKLKAAEAQHYNGNAEHKPKPKPRRTASKSAFRNIFRSQQ